MQTGIEMMPFCFKEVILSASPWHRQRLNSLFRRSIRAQRRLCHETVAHHLHKLIVRTIVDAH